MDAASWQKAKDVIAEALKRAPPDREAFVRERCQDPALAAEVLTMLAAYGGSDAPGPLSTVDPLDELDDQDDLEPGTRVGPYIIIDTLGRGGMGQVFLGSDPRLRRKVALKCVVTSLSDSGGRHLRILHEARAAARITHPNVAAVHDVVEHDDRAFIVMEYVEGESLAARLKRGRLPIESVLAIGRQLASAIGAAHAKGVIHRDLKPANIQITPEGSVKILDFGIANAPRHLTTAASGPTTASAGTRASASMAQAGTPPYMAPEQLIGRQADERSDVYSMGVVLFEMATGHRPYADSGTGELIFAQAGGAPRADTGDARVPRALADVVARALATDVQRRFQSASEVGAALEMVEQDFAARREPLWRATARVAVVTLTLSIVIGAVGFITTTGFNLTFGRAGPFATEPFVMYFVWGGRAVLPSAFVMLGTTAIVLSLRYVLRLVELIGPIGRTMAALRANGNAFAARAGLDRPAGLAQASAALALITLGAMSWYHADLITAWSSFVNSAPADRLMPIRPENLERIWYRIQFDVVTLGFGVLLLKVIRLQKRQKTHDGTAAVALLAAIIAVMVLMNEWPYRVLSHRDFERVDASGVECYITGESADDLLLFCPGSNRPRNRTVKRADPAVRRSGVFENVFEGLKPSRPGS
jgi:hypothetical protein